MNKITIFFILSCLIGNIFAQTVGEEQTAQVFERIKNNPAKLSSFLKAMPKGGDLHNHISGASYAENLVKYAEQDNLCVNSKTYTVSVNPACESQHLLNNAVKDPTYFDAIIDAWSMRHFYAGLETKHDHFFATFGKFGVIAHKYQGELIAEDADIAANQNESYLELMLTLDDGEATHVGKSVGWDPNFVHMRRKLIEANIVDVAHKMSKNLDAYEAKVSSILQCGTSQPNKACQVERRYLSQISRSQAPEAVFAQLLAAFEAASKDSRIVGLNLVQPEDGPVAMRDYVLQMEMVGYLRRLYPAVHVSLHAGELDGSIVAPEQMASHIHDAVYIAKTDRIGHGVDIAHENNSEQLLEWMAKQHIAVEIGLSSNAIILGVEGKTHPLPLYLHYNVPVVISTDDQGVSRSNLTQEFARAVSAYPLTYLDLKTFSRNSVAYSFLPGKSLWIDHSYKQVVDVCADAELGSSMITPNCQQFLNDNQKAKLQWDLEKRFTTFEAKNNKSL